MQTQSETAVKLKHLSPNKTPQSVAQPMQYLQTIFLYFSLHTRNIKSWVPSQATFGSNKNAYTRFSSLYVLFLLEKIALSFS